MSKAILEFNLDDPDDRRHHVQCVKASDMAIVLWNIKTELHRTMISHRDSQEYINGVEDTLHQIGVIMDQWNIDIDELN